VQERATRSAGGTGGAGRHPPVRLGAAELAAIREAAAAVLAGVAGARVWLYGSRADLTRRGGDIDLLITCEGDAEVDQPALTRRLLLALEDRLGERRIDVTWAVAGRPNAFAERVLPGAVELWSGPQ